MSTFSGKLKGDCSAHAIGATGDNDSLQEQVSIELARKRLNDWTYSTLDGELVLSTESEHFGKCVSDHGADQDGHSQRWGT